MTYWMRILRWVTVVAVAAPLAPRAVCQAAPDDAMTVRAVYAKFVTAMRVGSLKDGAEFPNEAPPSVEISEIQTGPIAEIAQKPLEALVTKPSGWILSVSPGDWRRTDFRRPYDHGTYATARWRTAGYLTEDWNVPFGRAMEMNGLTEYSRYAAFNVRLSYHGQQRQYGAVFLFGQEIDGSGKIFPIDHVVGISALMALTKASIVPGPLLGPGRARTNGGRAFMNLVRRHPACVREPVTGMCCDSATGQCGIAAQDMPPSAYDEDSAPIAPGMERAYTPFGVAAGGQGLGEGPLPAPATGGCSSYNTSGPNNSQPKTNDSGHVWGSHGMNASFQGRCTYDGSCLPCTPTCSVSVSASDYENGQVYTACHVTAANQATNDSGPGINCSGGAGYGVSSCLFCLCGVSVQLSVDKVGNVTLGGSANLTSGSSGYSWGPCNTVR
jgi:hypothetical protein